MRKFSEPEILALAAKWRERARTFMREARESDNPRDRARLAGMSSTLQHCSRDMCFEAGVDPNSGPQPVNADADQARQAADRELSGPNERQS
jgi:hypothetical protein